MENNNLIISVVLICFALVVGFAINSLVVNNSYVTNLPVEDNGGLSVNIQDQTTRPFDIPLNQILDDSYTLANTPEINQYDINLTDTTGLTVGDKIAFLEQNGLEQIYFGFIKSITGNTITLNAPVPFGFTPSLVYIFTFDNQLNVDGSTTTQVFGLTNNFNQSVDITRIIFKCTDNVEMHDGLFCGIDELTNGIEFRKYTNDGYYINYFNVRNNAKWGLLAYDVDYNEKGKPPDNTYGFSSRFSYAGQEKHGVVIRLDPGERIELLVQDDLTNIGSASLMAEGHFTQD